MLFDKTTLCFKASFIGHGFFLFNSEDNYNTTLQTLVIKDLLIYEFRKFYVKHVDELKTGRIGYLFRGRLEPLSLLCQHFSSYQIAGPENEM